jgi:hypothetical protein
MVTDLADYPCSSYAVHAQGRSDPRLTLLPAWSNIGANEQKRLAWWQKWVRKPLTTRELSAVRQSVSGGRPYGDAAWTTRTAATWGLTLSTRPRG